MKKVYRKFYCPLTQIGVHFLIGTQKDAKEFADNLNLGEYSAGCTVKIESKNKKDTTRSFLVWVDGGEGVIDIAHETLHLAKMVFDMYGFPFDSENDEIIAYYQGYWIRKFWNVFNNKVKCKSKKEGNKMSDYGTKKGQGKGKGMPGGGRRNQNPNPCGKGGKGIGKGTNR